MERHQNADYGFQHEYELLPERFADPTTRASDTRENMPKNRYQDIKGNNLILPIVRICKDFFKS
jgi:protein-tyrosine phosphatase